MAGFGAFLTHVFFSLPQEEEKNLKKNFSTSIIFDFISNYTNYIHICDWACENRACGHMIFAYFFKFSSLITFVNIIVWLCNFQILVNIQWAL